MNKAARPAQQRPSAAANQASAHGRLMKAVRAACRRKGIDDDDRRAIQLEVTGKGSMTQMSPGQLGKLLDHLNRDWTKPEGDRAHLGKMRALWWSLYWLGAIHRPDDEALTAFVTRQTGVEHLRFLDHRKAQAVIEALKSWLEREGVHWWSADEIASFGSGYQLLLENTAHRHAVLLAIGSQLGPGAEIYESARHTLRAGARSALSFTPVELDTAIRHFGKKLRQRRGAQP